MDEGQLGLAQEGEVVKFAEFGLVHVKMCAAADERRVAESEGEGGIWGRGKRARRQSGGGGAWFGFDQWGRLGPSSSQVRCCPRVNRRGRSWRAKNREERASFNERRVGENFVDILSEYLGDYFGIVV